jgi:hypothetical protein
VTTKNTVFWDVTPCDSLRRDVSEERFVPIIKVKRMREIGMLAATRTEGRCEEIELEFLRSVLQLLVTVNAVPVHLFFHFMMEVIRSSETSVHTTVTRHHFLEDDILQVF